MVSTREIYLAIILECYPLWQKWRLEGVLKIRGRHSSLIFAKNPKKIILKIFNKFSKFFSKFFKIRKFQMTGSDRKWVSNESRQHFKTFGWKIKFQKTRLDVILHDTKISVLDDESLFRHSNLKLTTKKVVCVVEYRIELNKPRCQVSADFE